jgi:peptide/nickel transport system permease protein
MLRYIGKRILLMIPVLLGVSMIIFTVMSFTPGDPVVLILGEGASDEAIEKLREEMGLDDPVPVQYVRYIKNALSGDLGRSYQHNTPVAGEIASRFPNTLRLTVIGTIIAVVIGIPVGIISAVKQYSIIDSVSLVVSMIFTSMPSFWLGLMLILFFSLRLDLFPATGGDTWRHFVLPSFALAAASMASLIRMTRSTMLEVIRQDYIRTARAKGASERRVVFKHALRNALLPVVTVIGLNFGRQLGGAIVTETVFAMPGLGMLMVNGIRSRDTPIVMGAVLFAAILAGVVNLLVDIFYTFIDPRLKSEFAKK